MMYFGDFRTMQATFTVAELKGILTYTPKGKPTVKVYDDLGATVQQLTDFLACMSIEQAADFDDQHARVLDLLKTQLNCEKLDAEAFYYNNALFTDGYEHVNFAPTMFNRRPIKTKVVQRGTGKATDQLADSSYFLKVLTADTYRKHRKTIQPLDVFFCESAIDVAKYFSAPSKVDVIGVDSLNTLADLAKLLTTK